uniref:response regulator transcription factor n=1 Tax=uncultured Sphingomonas sp. TaxID=158754 RepID=UPI0035CC4090
MSTIATALHLTHRESQVLNLVAGGRSAKEVALELRIAPGTVERHVENVRLKTRTRNRAHMIAVVLREGLLGELSARTG